MKNLIFIVLFILTTFNFLSKDASESNDIAQLHPKLVEELSSILRKWIASMLPSVEVKNMK